MKNVLKYFLFLLSLTVAVGSYAQKQGHAHIDSLLQELPKQKEDTNKVKMFISIGYFCFADSAVSFGQKALRLSEKLKWEIGEERSNRLIGGYYNFKSNFSTALIYFSTALKIDEALKDKRRIAKVMEEISGNYFGQGNSSKSLEYRLNSLKLYEELGDKSNIATELNDIGCIFSSQSKSDDDKALEYFLKASQINEELGEKRNSYLQANLVNIGDIYCNRKDYKKAIEYYQKGYKIEEQGRRSYGQLSYYTSKFGNVSLAQKNYSQALCYYFKALRMNESLNAGPYPDNLSDIGETYLDIAIDATQKIKADSLIPAGKTANINKAIFYFGQALKGLKGKEEPVAIQNELELLSRAQQLHGDYKNALENYIQSITIKDSLSTFENGVKITNLETNREIELKDKQIEIDKLAVAKKRNERGFYISGIGVMLVVIIVISKNYKTQKKTNGMLSVEKQKSEDLLLNILPVEIAKELKEKGAANAQLYDNVTVLFTDFVNFTKASERLTPQALIDELHTCFKAFDEITGKYNIEKIKTIGDAYLAVCGLPLADPKHAENIVHAALEINKFIQDRVAKLGDNTFQIRIGIHSGSVVAGIVGVKKFAYDIWGDTVNTAARMEQNSEAGRINISQTTCELVKDKFMCEYRGEIDAKGKGMLKMYFVV